MNGSGLAALIQGFQQGYTFMDDAERKKRQDAREDETWQRQEKVWKKQDDYDKEAQAISDKYFPRTPAAPPAAVGTMAPAPTAVSPAVKAPVAAAPTPGDASAGQTAGTSPAPTPVTGAAAAPVATPAAAALGAGTRQAIAPANPLGNLNTTLDFLKERALLDVKHGRMDGPGLLTLVKTIDGMKREKMDDAIKLLNEGRFDEAAQTFDSVGDHTGFKVVSSKDSTFKAGGADVPTKIVTVQDGNGNIRVIDTAKALYQQQDLSKIIEQAQKGQQLNETGRHNAAEEAISGITANAVAANAHTAAERLKLEQDQFKKQSLAGQIAQIETITGPLSADDKKSLGLKLAGLGKDSGALSKFAENVVTEGIKAGTVKPEDAMQLRDKIIRNHQLGTALTDVATELSANRGDPAKYAQSYDTAVNQLKIPAEQLQQMGFQPPVQQKPTALRAPMAAMGTVPQQQPKANQLGATFEERQKKLLQLSAAADADPDLQALQAKREEALRAGNPIAANSAITQYNALKKQRYGL